MTLAWLFDGLLALAILWIAWGALTGATLFKSVVLFIAFGLMMALAWVRLDAADIALAEAAIGAGLTGVLLLDAVGHIAGRRAQRASADGDARHGENHGEPPDGETGDGENGHG